MLKQNQSKYTILSVIGSHAGEDIHRIFDRKIQDVKNTGRTYWMYNSYGAKPEMVQKMGQDAENNGSEITVLFISAATPSGAIATKTADTAKQFSIDRNRWDSLPTKISPITGNLKNAAYAMILKELKLISGSCDLWDYADYFNTDLPLRIIQGRSTLCAISSDTSKHPNRLKSNNRPNAFVLRPEVILINISSSLGCISIISTHFSATFTIS